MLVLVECLKGTKEKYEINKAAQEGDDIFVVNRMLKRKWVANYGFVPFTLQADGDELDAYILGNKLKQGGLYEAIPVAMIYSVDHGQVDNKII